LLQTAGSTYRKRGARLLIESGGRTLGVLSGGCLEEEIGRCGKTVIATGAGAGQMEWDPQSLNLAPDLDAAVLVACDQPFVNAAVFTQLMQLRLATGKPIIASAYAETLGIPALFDRSCFPDLLRLNGDSGAKGIILARPHDVASFDFPAGEIDIDTAADYEKLDQRVAADGTRLG
jgi:molybdenum cofactor cytidylyltransferase